MSAEHLAGPYREPVKLPPPEGDPVARHAIELELEEGERLLWAGQPPQGVRFTWFDVFLIPFSIVWGGCSIFWEVLAIVSGAPFFFALFGIPFVAVGLYLMVGRFVAGARERARTFYGVTDRRALIVVNSKARQRLALNLEQHNFDLIESKKGSGSIIPRPLGLLMPHASASEHVRTAEFIFLKIPNARAVYQIMKDAQDDLRERRRIRVAEPARADTAHVGEEEDIGEEYGAPKAQLGSR